MSPDLHSLFQQFRTTGTFREGIPYGSGHINDTYRVITREKESPDYILQRINHHVFRNIEGLQNNIAYVTRHIRNKLESIPGANPDRQTLTLIPVTDGNNYLYEPDTGYWRCYLFIRDHTSYDKVEHAQQAFEAGKSFGRFGGWLSDLDPLLLTETIPGFHDMELRLQHFDKALKNDSMNRAGEAMEEIAFVQKRSDEMTMIQRLGREGKIPVRITHNDTKFNNVLLDKDGRGLCVIDLDTVMPGFIHYDFGDAIRTSGNSSMEDERNLKRVKFRMDFFEAFARGFLGETVSILKAEEIRHLAFSARVMTYIIGLRFLTDHLQGDEYFKIKHPGHNLHRSRVQFQLIREMEASSDRMERIIQDIVAAIK